MNWEIFRYWPIQMLAVGIVAKYAVAAVLLMRGLGKRYPGLVLFLAGGATQSTYLIWSRLRSPTGYADAYAATHWIVLALWGVLAVEGFVIAARHFPLTSFTLVVLAALATFGYLLATETMAPGIWPAGPIAPTLDRSWTVLVTAAVVMGGGFVLFRIFADFAFRQNVRWSIPIATGLLVCHVVALERARQSGTADRWTQASLTGGSIAAACMWGWKLRRDGEKFRMPPADPAKLLQAIGGINHIRREAERMRGGGGGPPRAKE